MCDYLCVRVFLLACGTVYDGVDVCMSVFLAVSATMCVIVYGCACLCFSQCL